MRGCRHPRQDIDMDRIARRVSTVLLHAATVCGITLTLFVALSAIMRYMVGSPFSFTEELVGLLFSALVFLALPYVTLHRQHIEVTLLRDCLPAGARRICDLAARALMVLFALWFGRYAFDFAAMSYRLNSRSDMAGIPLWPWMSLIVLSCLLMALFVIIKRPRAAADTNPLPPSGA
jgi:TRAP-type C4-dicarboxylate transport system permease small subunit